MALFTLPGIDGTDKVPMFAADNRWGQGRSTGTGGWYVLITGNKTAGGTMTADSDVEQIFDEADAATKLGDLSEAAIQAREALSTGAAVYAAPVAEAAGGVAATLVINWEALGTGTGTIGLYLDDGYCSWAVDVASASNTADNAVAAINAMSNTGRFCTATKGGATEYDVTLTVANVGVRGNDHLAKLDLTAAPTGCIVTLGPTADPNAIKQSYATVAAPEEYTTTELDGAVGATTFDPPRCVSITLSAAAGAYTNGSTVTFTGTLDGAAVTDVLTITGTDGGITVLGDQYFDTITQIDVQAQHDTSGHIEYGLYSQAEPTASGFVRFYGGTGSDNAANVIDLVAATTYRRIAAAQNDATNAARWEAHADSESAPLIEHLEQIIFGHNGTSTAAISLAQTTLNAYLCGVYAQRNSRKHPSAIAARVAGLRCVAESTNPWTRHDGEWNDVTAQLWSDVPAHALDKWSHAELKALLNAGVSPINDFNGDTRIVRSICTHCLNGTSPDYRCLDTADVSVPQYVRDAVKAVVTLSHESNPGVGPDLPDGQKQISGVATPSILNGMVQDALEDIEKRGWIMNVAANPPITEYNEDANRNEVIVPTVVRPHNHQTLASIRQIAS